MNKETPEYQAKRLGVKITKEQLDELYSGRASNLVLVIGKSGRGKSAGLRNLPPEHTHLISVVGKPLPFQAGALYREGKNQTTTASASKIKATLKRLENDESVRYIVIDDGQYIMATEFMARSGEKGYDKFTSMAKNMWDLLILCSELRPDQIVFFLTHEDDSGGERKMKTLGRLLDEKLTPEGLATIVLFADVTGESADSRLYFYQTQSDGQCNAKSPMGMFPTLIENDLMKVADRVDEYYSGVDLSSSEIDFGSISIETKSKRRR